MTEFRALPTAPVTDDYDTGGFWAAVQRHELVVQTCAGCQAPIHLPQGYCDRCSTWSAQWSAVSGAGAVYAWTAVHHQVDPAFPVPYTIILVELCDMPSVRLVGSLPGTPELTVGQRVTVTYQRVADDVLVPQWVLAPGSEP